MASIFSGLTSKTDAVFVFGSVPGSCWIYSALVVDEATDDCFLLLRARMYSPLLSTILGGFKLTTVTNPSS